MFQGMEYVYEVYKERSFSKAAANLFISQPSLSATIKRIEQQIGYPLFDRSTKPLGVTECGERYIETVKQILSAQNDFIDYINDWGNLKTGKLRVGGSNFFSSWVLPELIGNFARQYPLIEIVLIEESTANLEQLLQNGSLDFAVDNCLLDEAVFDHCIFQEEHLLLAVPRSFPVNEGLTEYQISIEDIKHSRFLSPEVKPVPLKAFQKEPFIMLKPENDTGKRALGICRKNHLHPHVFFELDQQLTAYNITCSGMGISFIGDMLISRVPDNLNLVYYKLPMDGSSRNVYFYWKKGRYFSRAMEEFLNSIQEFRR